MTEGAVVLREEKPPSLTEIVSSAVGFEYEPAYVSAMRALLPVEFQDDPVNVIALGMRARMSGLNPFTQIHAWKGDRGALTFQVDYKGFIDIAARDQRIESLEFQHVYEGEKFEWTKDGAGGISIEHSGGLKQGRLLGAYCCAHMAGDMADHMEMRLLEDFKHLFNKTNWRNNPSEMITARVVSATVRVVCPESSQGLYTEADWDSENVGLSGAAAHSAQVATAAAQEELAQRLSPPVEQEPAEEVEAVVVDPTPAPADPVDGSPTGSFEEKRFHCQYCVTDYDNQRSLAGHGRKHRAEKAMEKELPEGCMVIRDEHRFVGTDPDGEINHEGPTWVECYNALVEDFGTKVVTVKEENSLEVPEGYRVFVDRGGKHVAEAPDGEELGRYPTHDDAALAAINHLDNLPPIVDLTIDADGLMPEEPDPMTALTPEADKLTDSASTADGSDSLTFAVPKLAEIYRRVADKGYKTSEVLKMLNSVEYEDTFDKYRKDGASQVQPLDLDEDGRRELVDILQLRGIIE